MGSRRSSDQIASCLTTLYVVYAPTDYKSRRECHIEPDWLLIYKLVSNEIIFERTGTHGDLFE